MSKLQVENAAATLSAEQPDSNQGYCWGVLTEKHSPVLLRTGSGGEVMVHIQEDTIELTVIGSDRFFQADIETGDFKEI